MWHIKDISGHPEIANHIQDLYSATFKLPAHLLTLHFLIPVSEPAQDIPPFAGVGLLQERFLVCVPLPHVFEHVS